MAPAKEGLDAADAVAVQIELGLVVQAQLAAVEGVVQLGLHAQARPRTGARAVLEELVAARALLGPVHGLVGVAKQSLGRDAAVAPEGDAHARSDPQLAAVHLHGRLEAHAQTLGEHDGLALVIEVGTEDHELVAAEASHRVARPHQRGQPLRDLPQQGVPGVVTQGVVHHLEAVEVQEEHGHERARALGRRQRERQPIEQQPAVREPGEKVVVGVTGELELPLLALDRIADGPAQQLAVGACLPEVVLRALVDGLHGQRLAVVSAQHDDRKIGRHLGQLRERLEPGRVAEGEVEQDAVELPGHEVLARGRQRGAVTEPGLRAEGVVEQLGEERRVLRTVHDEEDRRWRLRAGRTPDGFGGAPREARIGPRRSLARVLLGHRSSQAHRLPASASGREALAAAPRRVVGSVRFGA